MTEFWLFAVVPFFVGGITAAVARRREAFDYRLLPLAAGVSCVVVAAVVFAWDLHEIGRLGRAVAGTIMYTPGFFMFGAIPAAAGCAIVQEMKIRYP